MEEAESEQLCGNGLKLDQMFPEGFLKFILYVVLLVLVQFSSVQSLSRV